MEDWTAVRIDNGVWRFTWDGDSAGTYYVWLHGKLLATVIGNEYDSSEPNYEDTPPPLEIVDDESATVADNDLYSPYAILQWREVVGAKFYLVEQFVSGAWAFKTSIQDLDRGYYWYRTSLLTDQTAYQFRVSALNQQGDGGTPIPFTFVPTRNPAPPDVLYNIDSTGDLVVTEA